LLAILICCGRDNPLDSTPPDTPIPVRTTDSGGGLPIDPNIFPIYNETYGGGISLDVDSKLWVWSATLTMQELSSGAPEGSKMQEVTEGNVGWCGFGIVPWNGANTTKDMNAFASGYLHLSVKSSVEATIEVGLESMTGPVQKWIFLNTKGFASDGAWHNISIPITDFTAGGVVLTEISQYVMFRVAPSVNGRIFYLDNIYWTKN